MGKINKQLEQFRNKAIYFMWETEKAWLTMDGLKKIWNLPKTSIYRIIKNEKQNKSKNNM